MTGTVTGLFTHKSVPVIFEPPCINKPLLLHLVGVYIIYRLVKYYTRLRLSVLIHRKFQQIYTASNQGDIRVGDEFFKAHKFRQIL